MTWAPFMLTYLIPDQLDHFVLQDLDSHYLLSFRQGDADVGVVMMKNLLITELRTAQGNVKPVLTRTANGFMLTGYEGSYDDPTLGHSTLKATIVNQNVAGLSLPAKVLMSGLIGQQAFNFELHFTNYRLKRNSGTQDK